MTEIAVRPARMAVPDKLRYAQALADSGLLPAQYRRQPANLLYAIEYAEMIGAHPLTAVTGIFVIDGKPSASAGLISALVRRAGHKLRVTGDAKSATAQIIRADDPDFTFEVTFTMDDAEAAKLAQKSTWKQYPAAMLKARAITQCARDACEDALSGLHYTAEELGAEVNEDGIPVSDEQVTAQIVRDLQTSERPAERTAPFADVFAAPPWAVEWRTKLAAVTDQAGLDECWADLTAAHATGEVDDGWAGLLKDELAARARQVIVPEVIGQVDILTDEVVEAGWPEVAQPGSATTVQAS